MVDIAIIKPSSNKRDNFVNQSLNIERRGDNTSQLVTEALKKKSLSRARIEKIIKRPHNRYLIDHNESVSPNLDAI